MGFLYANISCYRNTEIGNEAYDNLYIFKMLTLEGAQSGLSWNIVYPLNLSLKKMLIKQEGEVNITSPSHKRQNTIF
ncbi:DNA-3-methyladenine glycosylase I [Oceanobacillus massiliensis]|uniref:DNA-3-methyladenine glycosylase I n=1 Tax=Oceanobacillus massiliensis TaxID=1465765 RepID=UPI0009D9B738|nr:DNA-3-methyladenine glycosylase I [Oceanobacillus massiliensis]